MMNAAGEDPLSVYWEWTSERLRINAEHQKRDAGLIKQLGERMHAGENAEAVVFDTQEKRKVSNELYNSEILECDEAFTGRHAQLRSSRKS